MIALCLQVASSSLGAELHATERELFATYHDGRIHRVAGHPKGVPTPFAGASDRHILFRATHSSLFAVLLAEKKKTPGQRFEQWMPATGAWKGPLSSPRDYVSFHASRSALFGYRPSPPTLIALDEGRGDFRTFSMRGIPGYGRNSALFVAGDGRLTAIHAPDFRPQILGNVAEMVQGLRPLVSPVAYDQDATVVIRDWSRIVLVRRYGRKEDVPSISFRPISGDKTHYEGSGGWWISAQKSGQAGMAVYRGGKLSFVSVPSLPLKGINQRMFSDGKDLLLVWWPRESGATDVHVARISLRSGKPIVSGTRKIAARPSIQSATAEMFGGKLWLAEEGGITSHSLGR